MKHYFKAISLLLCSTSLISCSKEKIINKGEWCVVSYQTPSIVSTNGAVVSPFNTVMTLKYFKNELKTYDENFDNNIKNIFIDKINSLHKKFDRHYYYKDENQNIVTSIKTINDSYGSNTPVECDEELYTLLKTGYEMTLLTNGYFNFFIGELNTFWDNIFYLVLDQYEDLTLVDPFFSQEQNYKMQCYAKATPTLDEVQTLLTFDDENLTVTFNTLPDIEFNGETLSRSSKTSTYRPTITTGGIAKGLAVDYIKDTFKNLGYLDGFVNAGSSSIASFSAPTFFEKGYQTFNFADPRSGSLLRTLAVSVKVDFDYGISTSGNYNNKSYSFKPDDETKRVYRHHIVNPYTGDCSQEHASVTIFSRTFNNAQLDALSTMFVNLPLDQCISFRNELLEKYPSHDLSFIIMDRNDDDSLTIYIDQELKGISTVKAENCKVIYE